IVGPSRPPVIALRPETQETPRRRAVTRGIRGYAILPTHTGPNARRGDVTQLYRDTQVMSTYCHKFTLSCTRNPIRASFVASKEVVHHLPRLRFAGPDIPAQHHMRGHVHPIYKDDAFHPSARTAGPLIDLNRRALIARFPKQPHHF